MKKFMLALAAPFVATAPLMESLAHGQSISSASQLGMHALEMEFSASEVNSRACLDWARTRPSSEDRRLISVFASRDLSGSVYGSFDENNPPIASAINKTKSKYLANRYIFDLFDLPKDKFETTSEYLVRRQSAWSKILFDKPINLTIGNKRFDFNYNADTQNMVITAKFGDLRMDSSIREIPPALRFHSTFVRQRMSSESIDYFISVSSKILGRFESNSFNGYRPITISMSVAEARDVSSSGALFLKFYSPLFKDPRRPAAFQEAVEVEEMRHMGIDNTIFGDLECAVIGTAGGLYYDLLVLP